MAKEGMARAGDVVVGVDALTGFAQAALETTGMPAGEALSAAEALVRTSARGVQTHGVAYLHAYVRQLEEGGANPRAELTTVRETAATALVDGNGGNGLVTAAKATRLAMAKARSAGMATVVVRNSNHFGAAGHYALTCAEAGFVGLVTSTGNTVMAVTGSRARSIGNGVTAYGVPAGPGVPVVLDIALSVVAGGKVRMAQRRGERVPSGWILAPDGSPSTDPADLLDRGGALLPVGGHKGYGLTVFGEVMSGVLSGALLGRQVASWLKEPSVPVRLGHMVTAWDVEAFMPRDEFYTRLEGFRDEIHASPLAPGHERIYLPGEPEHECEQRSRRSGLVLEATEWQYLSDLADRLALSPQLEACRLGPGEDAQE